MAKCAILGERNMYFVYEMEDSYIQINFTYNIFVSNMELKHFKYEALLPCANCNVKILKGIIWSIEGNGSGLLRKQTK